MTHQPGKNFKIDEYKELIDISLHHGKNELPYLYKLLPELFEEKNAYACSCYFTITQNNQVNNNSERYSGIIPNKFEFILDHTKVVSNNDETREHALNGIMRKINSKYKYQFNLRNNIV